MAFISADVNKDAKLRQFKGLQKTSTILCVDLYPVGFHLSRFTLFRPKIRQVIHKTPLNRRLATEGLIVFVLFGKPSWLVCGRLMTFNLEPEILAQHIESTLLRPDATHEDVERLCLQAREFGFAGVCIQGSRVVEAVHFLQDSDVKVVTVVGFPLGGMERDVKRYETETAIDNGASEIDAVMNIGWFKEGKDKAVFCELRDIVESADERMVKIVIETALLTPEEIGRACKLAIDSGAHFVKTSTGFASRGATVEDIEVIRAAVGPDFGIKAAGGIRDTTTALALIEAGANRLGTSSAAMVLRGAA